jgi:hypothetical protein
MDADGERLLRHITMCHKIIGSLAEILESMLENVSFENPLLANDADYYRVLAIIATIKRAVGDGAEENH